MNIYDQIVDCLKQEYLSGATYQELADKYKVSYTHIHNLLNGKRSVSGISLDFLFRLFPAASVNLHGSANNNSGGINVGAVNGSGNFFNEKKSDTLQLIQNRILQSDALSAEEKVKFLKLIKEVEK